MRRTDLAPTVAAILTLALAAAPPVAAQSRQSGASAPARPAGGPARLGTFGDWTAATHMEGGQKVCYAFTRASRSEGAGNRQNVLLLVTQRPQGRDQVAVRAGYSFPRNAEVTMTIGGTELPFYTAADSAFARDGRAAVAAMRGGREAKTSGPGPNGRGTASDTFPLNGFTAAYEAISRECPPPGPSSGRR
ncbi:invasion associated locus B family protein [Roseomonas sp. NAR14]|uniref:Invasion associated locus B family protein n=1 Tax=Roseomonas acroporae TaxID=2937791 RepID=A0A9X2BUW7_9PROT|nr:invasion associated locus B family protein [Roseomonas acroporae]MCK8786012.1 invasion associated locus B family protein [Roseomonas acroporae]